MKFQQLAHCGLPINLCTIVHSRLVDLNCEYIVQGTLDSSGTLMSTYEIPSTTVPGRRAVAERLQQYSTMFEGFLREGGLNTELPGSDWVSLTHLFSPGQWKYFMTKLCDAYIQV